MKFQQKVLTAEQVQTALGCGRRAVWVWLKDLSVIKMPNSKSTGRSTHGYAAVQVIQALRSNRKGGIAGDEMKALMRAIEAAPEVIISTDHTDIALLMMQMATEERERFDSVGRIYVNALARAYFDRAHMVDLDRLKKRLITEPSVMKFVFCDSDKDLPSTQNGWLDWAVNITARIATPTEIAVLATKFSAA